MKTKIITTLGPSTNSKETLSALIEAGASIVRLNFSWGTHENMKDLITFVREIAQEKEITIPILQDLSGPRLVMEHGHKINNDIQDVITEKDKSDLIFGLDNGVEYVALSYVSSAQDIHNLRALMVAHGQVTPIIAKIERQEALDDIEAICDASDGIMIARGDLGIALPLEELPFVERRIIELCNAKGTFVIVATEMMLSMIHAESPTRAEVNDVATAIELGANAVMLSEETARGEYPVETVAMMKKIVMYAEEEKVSPHHLI
jgi:pyruvate kinase